MKIILTGSTSGIGRYLLKNLEFQGHEVVELGRNQSKPWQLGNSIPRFENVDALIHLAHDRKRTLNENIQDARQICESFSGKRIFLSSFSAHSKSKSKYGRSKFEIERVFSEFGGVSIRAGIVYGGDVGGVFMQLNQLILSLPLIPVPYSGNPLLFTSHIDDLVKEVISCLRANSTKTIFGAHSTPVTLSELMRTLSKSLDVNKPFTSLPPFFLDSTLPALTALFPKVTSIDSLLSLSNQPSFSEISQLEIPINAFRKFEL